MQQRWFTVQIDWRRPTLLPLGLLDPTPILFIRRMLDHYFQLCRQRHRWALVRVMDLPIIRMLQNRVWSCVFRPRQLHGVQEIPNEYTPSNNRAVPTSMLGELHSQACPPKLHPANNRRQLQLTVMHLGKSATLHSPRSLHKLQVSLHCTSLRLVHRKANAMWTHED